MRSALTKRAKVVFFNVKHANLRRPCVCVCVCLCANHPYLQPEG